MNPLQEKALYHITGQLDNNERAGAALEKAVSNYPYFAPAQNLLACYYQATLHPSATTQAARATIYHFNPRWWAYQLEESREVADEWSSPVFSVPGILPSDSHESELVQEHSVEKQEILEGVKEPIAIPTVEAVQAILRKIDSTAPQDMKQSSDETTSSPKEQEIQEKGPDKISNMLSSQLEAFRQPVDSNTPLPFEQSGPMHTIDYFASQGIKVNWQSGPRDNLTKKMMSFTDWLKQVKQSDKSGSVNQLEKKVAEDADYSVRKEEVVTEAMAEVLLRQGHREQAIQLFQKLSFQIPEKSSYFAIRIEQIKTTL